MKEKNAFVALIFAVLLLTGTFFYMQHNIFMTLVITSFIGILYFKTRSTEHDITPGDENTIYIFMAVLSVIMLASRLYRIFSYPNDYFGDELTDLVDVYSKIIGGRNFFSYVNRQGAALPLVPEIIYSSFMLVVRNNIDFFRIIPFLLAVITAVELYYFGRILKDSKFGIILCFLYSISSWTLFMSRALIANTFIPFFTVSFLLLFYQYIKKNDLKLFLSAWLIFFAGFFTYTSWVLMVPFAIYLLYEYRKELGSKKIKIAAVCIAVSIIIAVTAYLVNKSIITWSISRTNLNNNQNIIANIISNIINLPAFFMLPMSDSPWYTDKLALLSFAELIMLLGGIILCVIKFKDRVYRVFFVGFCISLFTLFISRGNPPRHILLLLFLIIVSGLFMDTLLKWRYSILLVTISVLFFVNAVFYMFLDWDNQLRTDRLDIRIAEYINKNYQSDDYVFMYTNIPLNSFIGEYSAFMRNRIVYKKLPEEKINRILFVSSSLLRNHIREIFPDIKMKYFYDCDSKKQLPTVLYDLDLSKDAELKKFFIGMSNEINEVNLKWWALDYDGVVNKCDEYCEQTDKNQLIILKNTFFRNTEIRALGLFNKNREIAEIFFNMEKPMFLTSEWTIGIAENYYHTGDMKNTILYLKMSAHDAPEWDEPKQALESLTVRGIH